MLCRPQDFVVVPERLGAVAYLAAAAIAVVEGVLLIVRMAFRASLDAGIGSAAKVLLARDDFKVVWIHAVSVPAQVVKVQPFGNRAIQVLKQEAMCDGRQPVVARDTKDAIAALVDVVSPSPARGCIAARFAPELLHEVVLQRRAGSQSPSQRVTVSPPADVVALAPPSPVNWVATVLDGAGHGISLYSMGVV